MPALLVESAPACSARSPARPAAGLHFHAFRLWSSTYSGKISFNSICRILFLRFLALKPLSKTNLLPICGKRMFRARQHLGGEGKYMGQVLSLWPTHMDPNRVLDVVPL